MPIPSIDNFVFGETLASADLNAMLADLGALADGTGIEDGAILPEHLVAGAGTSWAWNAYTPTWTNVTVGNGTNAGKYVKVGRLVVAKAKLIWGSGTSASGNVSVSLPVTSAALDGASTIPEIGMFKAYDGTNHLSGALLHTNTTTVQCTTSLTGAAGANVTRVGVNATTPASWNTSDEFHALMIYESAA